VTLSATIHNSVTTICSHLTSFIICCLAGSKEALLSTYQQRPELTCKVLRLAVRSRPTGCSVSKPDTSTEVQQAAEFAQLVLQMCATAAAAKATAAVAAAHARQLFALAVLCLKLSATSKLEEWQLEAALAAAAAAVSAAVHLIVPALLAVQVKQQRVLPAAAAAVAAAAAGCQAMSLAWAWCSGGWRCSMLDRPF
jgi:hypothetical protein